MAHIVFFLKGRYLKQVILQTLLSLMGKRAKRNRKKSGILT